MRKLVVVAVMLAIIVAGALGYLSLMKPAQRPASTDAFASTPERLERGRYLVENVLHCFDCHSEKQADVWAMPAVPGRRGGGDSVCWDEKLGLPGRVCFPNITPDPETGIGKWTDGEIARAIREGVDRDGNALFLMPFSTYSALSD